jgi:hypothetical protein
MDNVGRGFVPDRWRYGLNDDDFGSQKVVSVPDRANAKHSVKPGGPSSRGAFSEQALKPAKPELDPFVEHAHKLFSEGFED